MLVGGWPNAKLLIVAFSDVAFFPKLQNVRQTVWGTYQHLPFFYELFQDLEISRHQRH